MNTIKTRPLTLALLAALVLPAISLAQPSGFVWANQPTAASYTPSKAYSYSAADGAITIRRSGTGTYAVRFAGLGKPGKAGGNVQVTAYGSAGESCKVVNWNSGQQDFAINVRCFASSGNPADTRFSLEASWPVIPEGGFAWADNPGAQSYTPSRAYSYNSAGQGITIQRRAAGLYSVRFAGLGKSRAGGNVQISAYGGGSDRCKVENWNSGGPDFTANVRCSTAAGSPVDTRYSIAVAWPVVPDSGYAWANSPTASSYTPSPNYSYNSGGGITIQRRAAGTYSVRFAGLGRPKAGGNVQVSAYGNGSEHCKVVGWRSGGPDFTADVRCFAAAGSPADTRYSIAAGWPGGSGSTATVARLPGKYELQGSNGSVTLNIADGSADGRIRATVANFTVDNHQGMRIRPTNLNGSFTLQRRASEDFYLFVLQGEGTVVDRTGTSFPATFSLTGFRSVDDHAALTTQWAAAYEFAGNAEGIHGGIAAWPKRP